MKKLFYFIIVLILVTCSKQKQQQNITNLPIYQLPDNVETRWVSFENITGEKGAAAKENKGAKGHPSESFKPGESKTIFDIQGSGIIHRMWITIWDRSPEMLRSLKIDMYWDNADKPAVSVPFGDFFSIGLGKSVPFENALFSNPEGRSYNCVIPMPFRKAARITITNESEKELIMFFYDINYSLNIQHNSDILYFHAYWNREFRTVLGKDFEILPKVEGKGKYLGTNIGVIRNDDYENTWWGEGEVKIYLDGDTNFPTIAGTGTEDYIGTGWGQSLYSHLNQGSLIADEKEGQWCFYRYHIPDPIYFYKDCRVNIQQIGGAMIQEVIDLQQNGIPLIPVTRLVSMEPALHLLDMKQPVDLTDTNIFLESWVNFYRSDDWSATAYFYLDKPSNNLPKLANVKTRIVNLKK